MKRKKTTSAIAQATETKPSIDYGDYVVALTVPTNIEPSIAVEGWIMRFGQQYGVIQISEGEYCHILLDTAVTQPGKTYPYTCPECGASLSVPLGSLRIQTCPTCEWETELRQASPTTSSIAHPNPLIDLAKQINRLYIDCESALGVARSAEKSALQHAKECGELLLKAKQEIGHGNWRKWCSDNLRIPPTTAALYQRVAKHWDRVVSEADPESITLREASKLVQTGKSMPELEEADLEPTPKTTTIAATNPDRSVTIGEGQGDSEDTAREPIVGLCLTGYDHETGNLRYSAIELTDQPTQDEIDEANWSRSPEPVSIPPAAQKAAEQWIMQFGEGLSMMGVALKLLTWCSDRELEAIERWIATELRQRAEANLEQTIETLETIGGKR